MERHGIISGKGLLPYLGLTLGIGAVALAVIRVGYMAGAALGCLPLLLYIILLAIKKPYWAYTWLFIANYFVLGLTRYIPGLPAGIVMDCLIMFNLFTLLIRSCYKHVGWERARNGLTVASLVWLTYCFLELFNPQTVSATAWVALIRGYALYFVAIAILTPIIFYRYKDLKRILFIWSVLTLLAVLKSWIQRNIGFDQAEQYWLFVERGHTTHIIRTGVRYFSFFSDAANFGSSMGLSMVVFGIASLYYKNRWIRLYYIAVAAAACYGMMISGTRSALAVPFAGFTLFIILSKQIKMIAAGAIMLAGVFIFLNYTHIGHSNALIRRARSAFDLNDASFQVRLKNQELMRAYMKDKPFGVGIGLGGGKAKTYAPNAYLSQIPTDSWFVMIWVETGIVGLIVHLGVLFYILGYGCYQVMFRLRDKQLRGLTAGLTAGVFGIVVCSYSNEIFGQFPTGIIMYMSQAFIFLAPRFDRELAEAREKRIEHEHEYLDEA